ncbi:hypothetical protein K0U27_06625 [archaeon]|nr:hypothetical protein [archaeon]
MFFQIHTDELKRAIDDRLSKLAAQGHLEAKIKEQCVELNEIKYSKICNNCKDKFLGRSRKCHKCQLPLSLIKRQADDVVEGPPTKRRRTVRQQIGGNNSKTFERSATTADPYSHIPTNHKEAITMKPRDPIFLNPNSYASLITVLRSIGVDLAIQKYVPVSTKKWTVIVCDGLPYSLILRLLKETFTCKHCMEPIFTSKALKTHMADVHDSTSDEDLLMEFDWVLLRMGYGHYEMNMVSTSAMYLGATLKLNRRLLASFGWINLVKQ